jgi:hypothetical protein
MVACRPAKNERYLYVAPLGFEGAKPTLGPSLRPKVTAKAR